MAASSVATAFEWTPFSHGFVYWEYPDSEHLPPADERGQREWLEGFLQSHADAPNDPREWIDPDINEGVHEALRRTLAGQCDVDALLELLNRMLDEWREAGEWRRIRL
ncbi:MAG: hypothetical protein KDJ22_00340 [Candidatus Competibacteraceae bacterium]|nr:hypothetical protein [Candidatus Competibacteraceae bacterium]